MKKLLVGAIILLFIGTAIIPSNGQNIGKSSSRGHWLYVGGNGPGNYTRVQDAIDNASDGDTVFVYHDNSPYYANIFINHSLHLIGENRNTTVIDGNRTGDVIQINANNVNIGGFTLQNSSGYPHAGVQLEGNHSGSIIFQNNIYNNEFGIELGGDTSHNNISDNNISYNLMGGIANFGGENVIHGNTISHNRDRGIFASDNEHGTKINSNRIFNNGFGGISSEGSYDEICDNEIYSNKEYGICFGYGMPVANVMISNNKIHQNVGYGIYLNGFIWGHLKNFTICKNNIESNLIDGIRMRWTMGSTFTQNNIYHNVINAYFSNSFGNTWDGNYWGTSKRVKMLIGFIRPFDWVPAFITLIVVPWFNFDFHPAQQPYDIP